MTRKRDLKRLVRERQAQTGESYTTALRYVLARRPPPVAPSAPPSDGPIRVVEMVDLTELGAALGFRCQIAMAPSLAPKVEPAAVLERLRDVLHATEDDRALDHFRDAALRGGGTHEPLDHDDVQAAFQFLERVRAGLGGVSDGGRMLAMHVDGKLGAELLLFMVAVMPKPLLRSRPPLLTFGQVEEQLAAEDHEPFGFYARMMRTWMVFP